MLCIMNKSELAQLIDAYADAKATGNAYLIKKMIDELEEVLTEIFSAYAVDQVTEVD